MKKAGQKKRTQKKSHKRRIPLIVKIVLWIIGVIVALGVALYIFWQVSPWPQVLFIRYEFDKGGKEISQKLEKYVPQGVASIKNQQYRPNDNDAYLDVFYPSKQADRPLPTVVWVHGGAWVSGSKANVENYAKIIAAKGYTVISINYSIAPEKQYPTPVLQVNDALGYIDKHAKNLHVDKDRLVLAGDSAGSQIAAQVAALTTSQSYANTLGIQPKIHGNQIRGMLLNCGAYDMSLANVNSKEGREFLEPVLWAYSGTKDFMNDKELMKASVIKYVTKDFPPSFITAGNADPLEEHSKEFAKKLKSLGVPTSTLFYPEDHKPPLPHEYQFNLDTRDGKRALAQMLAFLQKHDE